MTQETEIKGGDRVSIETAVHQLYKDLSERAGENPEAAPFPLMKDVFMWAMALGVKANERRQLSGGRTQIFRWDQFSQDLDVPVLRAIAIAETEDVEVLMQEERILRIAEEYANAGIREISNEIVTQPGQALWNLANVLRQANATV